MKTLQQIQTSAKNIHATVIEHKDMYFLNFSKEGTYEKAQQWGKDNDLLPSTKEDIESIRHDNLPLICGRYSGYVVETTGYTFDGHASACYVWFDGSGRESSLDWQGDFGDDYDWFAFRKSLDIKTNSTSETLSLALAIEIVKKEGYIIYKQI